MASTQTMGATARSIPRRRSSFIAKDLGRYGHGHAGYHSETKPPRQNQNGTKYNKSNPTLAYDASSLSPMQLQMQMQMRFSPSPNGRQSRSRNRSRNQSIPSDEEGDGERSDNSHNSCSCEEYDDDHDSNSSSTQSPSESHRQSLDESLRGFFKTVPGNDTNNGNGNNISNCNSNGNGNGNKSESDPESSHSIRKRALHEAGLPMSVFKGNSKNSHNKLTTSNNSNTNNDPHTNTFRRESVNVNGNVNGNGNGDVLQPIHSESGMPPEYTIRDESAISRISLDNSGKAEAGRGGGNSNSSSGPNLNLNLNSIPGSAKAFPSRVWLALRTKTVNPVFLLLVTGVSMLGVGLYTQSYATLSITLDQVITNTHERRRQVAVRFDSIEKNITNLQRRMLELEPQQPYFDSEGDSSSHSHSHSHNHNHNHNAAEGTASSSQDESGDENKQQESGLFDEMVAVKEKMRIETSRISDFEKYIQATSLRDATRKYGKGILRVQLHLEFLSDRVAMPSSNNDANKNNKDKDIPKSNTKAGTASQSDNLRSGDGASMSSSLGLSASTPHVLVLEMAPLDLMPHSVYTFLEMVDAKLIDGCSFVLNAMNVIKAAPLPYDGSRATKKVRAFTKLGLDTVSFREYTHQYPHEQFTVGFAADGSPDFYINTDDNTEDHAGEPCFARIVSGFETVERMEQEPTRSGMWYKKRIGIKSAVII